MKLRSSGLRRIDRMSRHLAFLRGAGPHIRLSGGGVLATSVSAALEYCMSWLDSSTLLIAGPDGLYRYHVAERSLECIATLESPTAVPAFVSQAPDGRICYVTESDEGPVLMLHAPKGAIERAVKLDQPWCLDIDWGDGLAHVLSKKGIESVNLSTGARGESKLTKREIDGKEYLFYAVRPIVFQTYGARALSPNGSFAARVEQHTTLVITDLFKATEPLRVVGPRTHTSVPATRGARPIWSDDSRTVAATLITIDSSGNAEEALIVVDVASREFIALSCLGKNVTPSPQTTRTPTR